MSKDLFLLSLLSQSGEEQAVESPKRNKVDKPDSTLFKVSKRVAVGALDRGLPKDKSWVTWASVPERRLAIPAGQISMLPGVPRVHLLCCGCWLLSDRLSSPALTGQGCGS